MTFNLRTKLFAGFGAVLVLMTLLGLFAVSRLGAVHDTAKELGTDTVPSLELIGTANGLVNKYRKDQLRYAVATDAQGRKDAGADVTDDERRLDEFVKTYDTKYIFDAGDRHDLDAFSSAWRGYVARTERFKTLAEHGDVDGSVAVMTTGAGDKAYD